MLEPAFIDDGRVFSDGNVYVSVAEVIVAGSRQSLEVANVACIYDGRDEFVGLQWYHWLSLGAILSLTALACYMVFAGAVITVALPVLGGALAIITWTTIGQRFSGLYEVRLYTDDGPTPILVTREFWYAHKLVRAINRAIEERNRVIDED